jgi:hypothetical protein
MTAPTPSKTQLTPEQFGKFLRWLSPDDQMAAAMYLEMRRKMVEKFIRKASRNAEDLADETLDRVARNVSKEPERYLNPMAYCHGVARNVWLEDLRKPPEEELDPEKIIVPQPEDWDLKECKEACMKKCVDSLPEHERYLITQYFGFQGREKIMVRKRLAEGHGGLSNLRTKACRIRIRLNEGLDDCIGECMNRNSPAETRVAAHGREAIG